MFQHNMTALLASLDEVEVTIDNFSLFRWGEHGARLDSKLNEIQQSGLKPKKDKCEFRKSEIEYFGHIISGDGVRPSEKRLTVIKNVTPVEYFGIERIDWIDQLSVNNFGQFSEYYQSDGRFVEIQKSLDVEVC